METAWLLAPRWLTAQEKSLIILPIPMDTSQYKELFLSETNEHLLGIEKGLLRLEGPTIDADRTKVVDSLFRHYHSIKGMCASMGYEELKDFSHIQENLLEKLRKTNEPPGEKVITVLLEALDIMKDIVSAITSDRECEVHTAAVKNRIAELAASTGTKPEALPPRLAPEPPKQEPSMQTQSLEAYKEEAGTPRQEPTTELTAQPHKLRLTNVMKVDGRVFDEQLRITGEMIMSLSSLRTLAHIENSLKVREDVHKLSKTIEELHKNILNARMLPFKVLTENIPRTVRDISKKSGKDVSLDIKGSEIRLDRSVLEALGDPLLHIIRNCVDHGIENPDERRRAGKPDRGEITIETFSRGDKRVIEVSDDGQGIDVARLKEKAVRAGADPEKVATLDEKQALMLVCMPGLSLKDSVTDVSGRGVGMDLVKNRIEAIRGGFEIDSTPGEGTRFTMVLPRSTSIVKILLVSIAGEVVGLPVASIEKVVEVDREDISFDTLTYRGAEVPLIDSNESLRIRPSSEGKKAMVVLFGATHKQDGTFSCALEIDEVVDELDAYIRPLVPPFSRLTSASGFTILGDGRPVFLLDVSQLMGILQ